MTTKPFPLPRLARASLLRGGLALVAILGLAGCGQRFIDVQLSRPGDLTQPVWVGVYFLSQESALEHYSNLELAREDGVAPDPAVVDSRVFPVKPGDVRSIELPEYDQRIAWVEVAAGLPDRCARQRVAVEKDAELRIVISVAENCIELTTD